MPYLRSIDIDDKSDFMIVEHIFKKFKQMKYKKISNSIIKSVNIFTKRKNIPLHEPSINEKDFNIVKKCLKSSYVSTVSKFTNLFEKEIIKLTKSVCNSNHQWYFSNPSG